MSVVSHVYEIFVRALWVPERSLPGWRYFNLIHRLRIACRNYWRLLVHRVCELWNERPNLWVGRIFVLESGQKIWQVTLSLFGVGSMAFETLFNIWNFLLSLWFDFFDFFGFQISAGLMGTAGFVDQVRNRKRFGARLVVCRLEFFLAKSPPISTLCKRYAIKSHTFGGRRSYLGKSRHWLLRRRRRSRGWSAQIMGCLFWQWVAAPCFHSCRINLS